MHRHDAGNGVRTGMGQSRFRRGGELLGSDADDREDRENDGRDAQGGDGRIFGLFFFGDCDSKFFNRIG